MEAHTWHKQVSSVTAYKSEFELLSNCIRGVSEKNKFSFFLGGLQDEIRLLVQMLNPLTFNDAFGLAKIQEQYVWSTWKPLKSSFMDFSQQSIDECPSRSVR